MNYKQSGINDNNATAGFKSLNNSMLPEMEKILNEKDERINILNNQIINEKQNKNYYKGQTEEVK